jgi:tyrosinase
MRRDADDFLASPVLNGRVSFGGNGAPNPNELPPYNKTAGGDISDGWFAGEIIHVGVGNDTSPARRRIRRNLSQYYAGIWFQPEQETRLLDIKTFNNFSIEIEARLQLDLVKYAEEWGLHSGGHRAVGGEMVDPWSSPSEPLFYLHHANMDRVWARWQAADPRDRQWRMGGPIAPRTTLLGPWPYPPPPGDVTLDHVLDFSSLGTGDGDDATVRIARVMSIVGRMPRGDEDRTGVLCYEYDRLW